MPKDSSSHKSNLRQQLAPTIKLLNQAAAGDFSMPAKPIKTAPELAGLHKAIENLLEFVGQRTTELEAFLQSSPQFIVEIDKNFSIVFVNHVLPGLKKEEVIGKNVLDFLPSTDKSRIEQVYNRVLKTGKTEIMEFESLGPNNTSSWYRASVGPVMGPNGVDRLVVISEDISSERKVLDELRQSEQRFKSLTDTAEDAIVSANDAGLIVYFNKVAEKMFGYKQKELLDQPLATIIPELDKKGSKSLAKNLEEQRTDDGSQLLELDGKRRSGEMFTLEMSLATWQMDKKNYLTGIMRDITNRKTTEKALNERTAELEKFNELMVGRELKMIELKERIAELEGLSPEKDPATVTPVTTDTAQPEEAGQ